MVFSIPSTINATKLMFFFIMLAHLVQKHHQPAAPSSVIDHKEQSATCGSNKN